MSCEEMARIMRPGDVLGTRTTDLLVSWQCNQLLRTTMRVYSKGKKKRDTLFNCLNFIGLGVWDFNCELLDNAVKKTADDMDVVTDLFNCHDYLNCI
jgi:hypothetical protein